ncbi:MAG: hypothetical protein IJM59_03295 [Proteobacteria bacterium]|nr:hypothetical protein [Pseudomonadota bacterium]
MYISYSENEKAFWLNDNTETDELFSPANVTLTLNVNKESEVTNGNEWLGTTWKEIKFVEGN